MVCEGTSGSTSTTTLETSTDTSQTIAQPVQCHFSSVHTGRAEPDWAISSIPRHRGPTSERGCGTLPASTSRPVGSQTCFAKPMGSPRSCKQTSVGRRPKTDTIRALTDFQPLGSFLEQMDWSHGVVDVEHWSPRGRRVASSEASHGLVISWLEEHDLDIV